MRIVILCCLFCSQMLGAELAMFTNQTSVGRPAHAGSFRYDPATRVFQVSGGGENMWSTNDAFHFVYARCTADFSLSATIDWPQAGGDPHRKACLMLRESLEPDSPYVDVVVHGNGLTSLQHRAVKGGMTREIQVRHVNPARVGLRRFGNTVYMRLPDAAGKLGPAGPFIRVELPATAYAGLAVCAHNDQALETARFSDVSFEQTAKLELTLHSSLERLSIKSLDRRVLYHSRTHFEAPNWSPDGKFLLVNSAGRIQKLPSSGGEWQTLNTGFAEKCNNDHGISPDGTRLAISDQSKTGKSLIYTLPIEGGTPTLVTLNGPSYWHGWSPDGRTLVYCAERNGEYDVYSIPAEGGNEKRLTTTPGLDDGPEFSPDGKFIYFNSERSGRMQIWRMRPDGSAPEQITNDEWNNWFPHPSPDGRWIVCLAYNGDVKGHPANQPVRLRLIPVGGGPIQEVATLLGGQGTINVPSWSPDSQSFAFVSYEMLPE